MNQLRRWWWRQYFEPGPLGWLANPFYFARRGLWRGIAALAGTLTGEVLDVGCGRKPYRDLVPAARYVGLEVDSPAARALGVADVYYDGAALPFADASFDAVICSEVLEHIFTPEEFLREIHRVLRPAGRLLLTVPFAWDEHEQPRDFARYSSFGLGALLERAGFEILERRKSVEGGQALFQLSSAYLYKVTRSRSRVFNHLAQLVMIAPVNLLGVLAGGVLPRNADFYLDNIVLARRPASPA
ncbi:MAG TPA: class I SAM-dependent methyltransferase [Candidatus Acidoferrales bacterium]|nr:class I SAM-dependent methyltransferase [Candidatus Acidoferrales bacterium]